MVFKEINFSVYEESFLEQILLARMQAVGLKSWDQYKDYIAKDLVENDILFSTLHNSYSQFFRNTLTFAVLEKIVLPRLVQKAVSENRRELRIWSAGCAWGQEAYSVAILLEEILSHQNSSIDYRIFATDTNFANLERARAGIFSEDTCGHVSLKRLKKWFILDALEYQIHPKLLQKIEFSVFDLLNTQLSCPPSSIFGCFDLIICCNVLFYYKAEYCQMILEKFDGCLGKGAYLVTGETERMYMQKNGYKEIEEYAAVFSKK